ncbi:glycosyl hydrolase family 47-domain-containing protein [Choanephora cucurbitarum]|nr:glycosyl hydrolase family 47-domain-containing protein [Choanephora cucurbitarum]
MKNQEVALPYTARVPKKWRIVLAVVSVVLVIGQLWIIAESSTSSIAIPEEIETILNEQQSLDNDVQRSSTNRTHPKKQSLLEGFGGFLSKLPQLQHNFKKEPVEYTKLRDERRAAIKKSFLHGWSGYKKYALGHDELKPISNKTSDPFGGWGVTMVDALSTLAVMELNNEIQETLPKALKIKFKIDESISVFETVIRYMGGLISIYELTDRKSEALIQKAEKLGQELLPAFDTPTGLPYHYWNPVKQESEGDATLIAEVGSVQLEFMMLSQLTGNPIYGEKAQAITDFLDNLDYGHGLYIKGLYPTKLDVSDGRFLDATASFGAMGDSAFEYFLKEYILTDGLVPQYGRLYRQSIESMKRYMLRQVPGYDMLMLSSFDTQHKTHKDVMDHLTCFMPGMLAMGAKTFDQPEDLEIAKGLLETCVFMYRTTKTGLSPESWAIPKTEPYNPLTFNKTKAQLAKSRDWWYDPEMTNPLILQKQDAQNVTTELDDERPPSEYVTNYKLPPIKKRPESLYFGDKQYVLRPETVESLFILYRLTGDQKYQEYGWEIYQAIERWCKTGSAYAAIRNVDIDEDYSKENSNKNETFDPSFNQIDTMESFLLAETFKYLYLLFSPPELISLDKFVFNTEAHPFVRKQWNWDKILKHKSA